MKLLLFHTVVQWLSKSSILSRIYEQRKEVELFLKAQRNQNLLHLFTADGFQLTLPPCLVDIFEVPNLLKQHVQDCHTSRIDHYDST